MMSFNWVDADKIYDQVGRRKMNSYLSVMSTGNSEHASPNSRKLNSPNHGMVIHFYPIITLINSDVIQNGKQKHIMIIDTKTTGKLPLKKNRALCLLRPSCRAILFVWSLDHPQHSKAKFMRCYKIKLRWTTTLLELRQGKVNLDQRYTLELKKKSYIKNKTFYKYW
jgi:hypothetical protein